MEVLQEYVVVVVMAICLAVGFIIKHSFAGIPNKYIPLILGVLGVVLNAWVNGWMFTPEMVLRGLASGLAATGAFELVRNMAQKG